MANDLSLLIADLSDSDVVKRRAAAEQLSRRSDARAAAIPLVRAAGDSDEQVREFAASALEELGSPPSEETAALAELLTSHSPDIGYWAATLLGRCGSRAALAVPALAKALTAAESLPVRQRAAWALGEIGPAASSAKVALTEAGASSDSRLARLAAKSLEKIQ